MCQSMKGRTGPFANRHRRWRRSFQEGPAHIADIGSRSHVWHQRYPWGGNMTQGRQDRPEQAMEYVGALRVNACICGNASMIMGSVRLSLRPLRPASWWVS